MSDFYNSCGGCSFSESCVKAVKWPRDHSVQPVTAPDAGRARRVHRVIVLKITDGRNWCSKSWQRQRSLLHLFHRIGKQYVPVCPSIQQSICSCLPHMQPICNLAHMLIGQFWVSWEMHTKTCIYCFLHVNKPIVTSSIHTQEMTTFLCGFVNYSIVDQLWSSHLIFWVRCCIISRNGSYCAYQWHVLEIMWRQNLQPSLPFLRFVRFLNIFFFLQLQHRLVSWQ